MTPKPTPRRNSRAKAGKSLVPGRAKRLHPEAEAQLTMPVEALRTYPGNPRRGAVEAIKESLRRNGQYRPIVVNRRTSEVLAGNHVLLAAKTLGWKTIAVSLADVDPEQAKRIVLADNRTSDLASYDTEALVELLAELPDLEGTGYDQKALDELLAELRPVELPGEAEDVPSPSTCPSTKEGDLYLLGRHRLLCGDATLAKSYERLLAGERAELLWTDPPYGVSYTGRTKAKLKLRGDGDGIEALLRDSFRLADEALLPGAPLYVCHPAGALSLVFGAAFVEVGWQLRQTLVWAKDQIVLGRSDYHYRHEPILYGYKPASGRLGRGGAGWHGDNSQASVIEIARPRASREHPTMKPPELVAVALRNSSSTGAIVLDPFAGSGSVLVACEALGRSARLVELDPRYCDAIVGRYERLTGERAARKR
jgi:DNA modification methylase